MKLALARAMLLQADILLLDEPTNHLDTTNVAWLVNYLCTQPNITAMIVSHDSTFLDNVCTDIFHYESRKLKRYRGNLSEFVKVRTSTAACTRVGVDARARVWARLCVCACTHTHALAGQRVGVQRARQCQCFAYRGTRERMRSSVC